MNEFSVVDLRSSVARAAETVRLEHIAGLVHEVLADREVDHILLKGPSFSRWLYQDRTERQFVDVDFLVEPKRFAKAEGVLQSAGFEPVATDPVEDDIPQVAVTWLRSEDRAFVDLHFSLFGADAAPQELWAILNGSSVDMAIGDHLLRVLSVPARAMHVALHAAQHGPMLASAAADLDRALAKLPLSVWAEAHTVAADIRALASFNAGLRTHPAGVEVADRLGLPTALPSRIALQVDGTPVAPTLERIGHLRGIRRKSLFVWRKVFPSTTYLKAWSATSGVVIRGPLHARVVRVAWIIRHLPRGIKGWRAARRGVSHV